MKYRVRLQRLATHDLDEAYCWAARHAPQAAARWLERFQSALQSLDTHPERCGKAREDAAAPCELREFHFGKKPSVFRVIFTIDSDVVRVLRIRRAQRRQLTRRQIEDAVQERE